MTSRGRTPTQGHRSTLIHPARAHEAPDGDPRGLRPGDRPRGDRRPGDWTPGAAPADRIPGGYVPRTYVPAEWAQAELGMPLPPPVTPWERDKAGWAELSGLIGMSAAAVFSAFTLGLLVLATWIAPFVFLTLYRNHSPYVRYHATQALNVQLTGLIVGVGAVLLSAATLGLAAVLAIPITLVFWLVQFVFVIIATSRAEAGEWYAIPAFLAWPMVR